MGDAVLMPNYARLPLVLEKGRGAILVDIEGKTYLDFTAGIAVNIFGHADRGLTQVVSRQAKRFMHVSNLYYHIPQIALAQALVRRAFPSRVFFCNSGAEANEAAIKLARRYAKQIHGKACFEIISTYGSFHGRTMAALAATGQEKYHAGFEPMLPGFRHVPYDDPEALSQAMTPSVAAVLVEPIQGEGGVRIPDPQYLISLRKICDRHGALLILDEIQTGMGRTGKLFAYAHSEIVPDILTLAKGLGGGMPMGAMLARPDVAACFSAGSHASTFGGNPVACAAAIEVIRRLTPAFLSRVDGLGAVLLEGLADLQKETSDVTEVRGVGLMAALDLSPEAPTALEIIDLAQKQGLLLNRTSERTLRILPPLTITRAQIKQGLSILSSVLTSR